MASFVRATSIFAVAASTLCAVSSAHEAKNQGSGSSAKQIGHHPPSGIPGNAGDLRHANLTMTIEMSDDMRFRPSSISVTAGDTVRFILKNKGKIKHEFVLGTIKELRDHAELMKKFPNMEHSASNMVTVAPGQKEEVIWHFTTVGSVAFGCLQPGHLEAGMVGSVAVNARTIDVSISARVTP